jgi:uroporphyrinogen decarboxylase
VGLIKPRCGKKIGVVGGIDVDFLARQSAGGFATYTLRVLEECTPGGGYALGWSNSVANHFPAANYFAVLHESWTFPVV